MTDRNRKTDIGDDGLPLDPAKRQAAVVAQFDDALAQLAALMSPADAEGTRMPDERITDEQHVKELFARFKGDVQRLALSEPYGSYGYLVLFGLIDVGEALSRRSLRSDPAPLAIILSRLDDWRAHLLAVGQAAKTPNGLLQ